MTDNHPVWHVYDELRTARLNVYYYRSRLGTARRGHTFRELVLAASGSTGVAGLWFFATGPGTVAWKALATVAALLAVYHSVARPSERIRKLETHVTAWTQMEHALSDIRRRIHEAGRYDQTFQNEVKAVLDRKQAIAMDLIETDIDHKLLRACFDQVKRELPVDQFFVPS